MASTARPLHTPSPDEVREIARISDPVLRNLRITECYFRLSHAFTAWTGQCANWCTFAAWASRQAGYTIRAEDLFAALESRLATGPVLLHPVKALWRTLIRHGAFHPETRLGRLIREIHTPLDAFEAASESVSRGNLKVFEEIAFEFVRYMQACPPGASATTFVDSLRPGDAPAGQALLRRAFTLYTAQTSEPDPGMRAQMICLANILIGLHEQTRLQPEIRRALESGYVTVASRSFVLRLLRPLTRGLSRFGRELTREVITSSLMVLRLPETTLQLSRHIDRSIDTTLAPVRLPDLQPIIEQFEVSDCGAGDWSDLDERMRYIARLFRCFHHDPALLKAPFSPEQCVQIQAGAIPEGAL